MARHTTGVATGSAITMDKNKTMGKALAEWRTPALVLPMAPTVSTTAAMGTTATTVMIMMNSLSAGYLRSACQQQAVWWEAKEAQLVFALLSMVTAWLSSTGMLGRLKANPRENTSTPFREIPAFHHCDFRSRSEKRQNLASNDLIKRSLGALDSNLRMMSEVKG